MPRGAPKDNANAKKTMARVPACLSISDEGIDRLGWAARKLQEQGIEDPTQQQISRFVKDFCYAKIDEDIQNEIS